MRKRVRTCSESSSIAPRLAIGIGLSQILHGFYQQALAVHVAGIGSALTTFASNLGRNRDRKNFGHAIGVSGLDSDDYAQQYTAPLRVFQPLSLAYYRVPG